MKQSDDNRIIPMTSFSSGNGKSVTDDVYYYTNQIVNVVMLGKPGEDWFLIDCGMPGCGEEIIAAAEDRYGKDRPPVAIFLSHGHFDHVGGIVRILEKWDVPVYAHPLEIPFITGKQEYPEPDTSVEGGLLAKLSFIYPHEPIDISERVSDYPVFFREKDRILISADAFITVKQDSFYKVLVQKREVQGPPRYLTTDWAAARDTVARLKNLSPSIVISGHGQYMEGEELRLGLNKLADDFETLAVPSYGRFVK